MAAGRTVLLVEDDDDLRGFYRQVLLLAGYRVLEARSGIEALQRLETDSPDIVVLDLLLPGVDGYTVREELAAQSDHRNTPILVVTASMASAEELDVDCVLRKPVGSSDLLMAVRRCLDHHPRRNGPES
jgi:DNA-binding response OmpR family regulator